MEFMGIDMTVWSPGSVLVVGVALIVVWGMFGKRGRLMDIDYTCGHKLQGYPRAVVPTECPECGKGRMIGVKTPFYMSDSLNKAILESRVNMPTEAQLKADWGQAPEWDGEGWPPIGCECRMTLGFAEYDRVRITYMGDGVFCYLNMRTEMEYTGSLRDATFRPIRTKEQRERDELKMIIKNWSGCPVEAVADAIIAAGWHKSKGEPGVDDSPRAKGFVCGEAYRRLPDEDKASLEWQAHAERIISHLYDAGMLRKAGEE